MNTSYADRFRSPEAMANYRAAYDAALALWPMPPEAHTVATNFGTTHLNVAGPPDAPPLLLVHGGQVNSTQWYSNIGPLSQHFRVYALDVVDQMGRSIPTRQLETPEDCATWLGDVLDALHIERASFIGHSHGGWQCLNLALTAPERVERMALLSPSAALYRLSLNLFFHMLPVLIRPTRGMFYWSFQWLTTLPLDPDQPHPLVEQFMVGALSFKPQELALGVISVFSDDELRRITTPTLLLIGEQEVVYRARPSRVLARAQRLMPNVEAHLIPGGKHLFPISQAEATNARMVAFLTG